ncbi:type IV conjugative transfer system protein TraE [Moritella viscosa]|uniref:type IV conjugative transfer system protein TraE n=1 Tax=Moritella viscosa TaxID=80854 RepID=UPI00091E3DF5|nr:type IV conjugative transfer system protein TraE [Moritella viscosa]SGZ09610.1 Conjugative transfer protein TraE [Moritella viscosa]
MLKTNEINVIAIIKSLNYLLLIGFIISMLVNAILGVSLYKVAVNKSSTITPPIISKAFSISGSQVDESYLAQMGEYFLYLKLNVTPANVEKQYSRLLDYVDTSHWSAIQPKLVREALEIKKSNIANTFNVNADGIAVDLPSMQVKMTGTIKKYVGSRALTPEEATYIVSLRYSNGILTIIGIKKEVSNGK